MSLIKLLSAGLLVLFIFFCGCKSQTEISVPEKIVELNITKVISGEEASKNIDNMHGLDVTPEQNIIAEYGDDPKDLLYISEYSTEELATKSFKSMITKMLESSEGPFTHIRPLPDYENDVYISIGMGAIHYIFRSTNYILWLQTYQEIGRELPENLLNIYPVK